MHRSIAAIAVCGLAIALVLVATYQAFFLLATFIPQGILLGLTIFALGIVCILACAAVGCTAHKWLNRADYGDSSL